MHYEKRIKQSKETTDWLHKRGIQSKVRRNIRKLYNIGKTEGPGLISYEQAKDLRSNFHPVQEDLSHTISSNQTLV